MAKSKEPCAYVSLWIGDGGQRPALKGVVKFTIDEMKDILNEACQSDPDDYDQYSLDIALWEEEEDGRKPAYKGKLSVRKPKDDDAPKKRRSTRR